MATATNEQNLIGGLLNKDLRDSYVDIVTPLKLDEPYETLKKLCFNFDSSITVDDLFKVAAPKLGDLTVKQHISSVTPAVFRYSLNELLALRQLDEILDISVENETDNYNKLQKIHLKTDNYRNAVGSKARLSTNLELDTTVVYHRFCGYDFSLGDACIIAAYPGVGKTRTLLSMGLEIKQKYPDDKVLYISIADWTPGRLHSMFTNASYPEIYVSTYDTCSMDNVKADVESVKPKVLLLDYLGVMDFPSALGNAASPRHGIKWLSDECKKLAVRNNMLVVSAYQLRELTSQPVPDELFESKTGLLSAPDLVLALGCRANQVNLGNRNLVCFKARHQPFQSPKRVMLDATKLTLKEV